MLDYPLISPVRRFSKMRTSLFASFEMNPQELFRSRVFIRLETSISYVDFCLHITHPTLNKTCTSVMFEHWSTLFVWYFDWNGRGKTNILCFHVFAVLYLNLSLARNKLDCTWCDVHVQCKDSIHMDFYKWSKKFIPMMMNFISRVL